MYVEAYKTSSLKFYFLPLCVFAYVNHRSLLVISYHDIYNSKIINTVKRRLTATSVIRSPRY